MSDTPTATLSIWPASSLPQDVLEELERVGVHARTRRAENGRVRVHRTPKRIALAIALCDMEGGLAGLQALLASLRLAHINYTAQDATGAGLLYEARAGEEWGFQTHVDAAREER